MITSQGQTPRIASVPLPMKAKGRSGLKIVVSLPISRAMPRTAVSEPSVTMKGGRSTNAISTPLIRPKTRPGQQCRRGCPAGPQPGISETSSADHGGRREDGADREVDAAGQDHEGHARRKHGVDRGLLRDDREVLRR